MSKKIAENDKGILRKLKELSCSYVFNYFPRDAGNGRFLFAVFASKGKLGDMRFPLESIIILRKSFTNLSNPKEFH